MKRQRILISVPVGWFVFTQWAEWFMEWASTYDRKKYEVAVKWEVSNTKTIGYSRCIENAQTFDPDFFWLLETNHQLVDAIDYVVPIVAEHKCCFSPSIINTDHGREVRAYPVDFDGEHFPAKDKAWEAVGGGTAFVSIDGPTLHRMVPWYRWNAGPDPGHPIFGFDGVHPDGQIRSIDYSIFEVIRKTGAKVMAEPRLRSWNFRLKGQPSYGFDDSGDKDVRFFNP